MKHSFNIYRSL